MAVVLPSLGSPLAAGGVSREQPASSKTSNDAASSTGALREGLKHGSGADPGALSPCEERTVAARTVVIVCFRS
jgi:hypothetical protein